MSTFFTIIGMALLALAMFTSILVIAGVGAWQLVYYVMGCRKAPIQKTALVAAAIVWVLSGAVISLIA